MNRLGSVDIDEQSNWLERFIEKIKSYLRICSRFEKLEQSLLIGTYPPNPFLRGRGTVSGFARVLMRDI